MWGALIALLGPLLLQQLGLFGGTDETQEQKTTGTTTTTATPTGYQSPTLGLLDLLMQGTLGKNLQTYSNWGLPAGKSIAPDYLQDFLSLIGSEYTNLQNKYTNPTPLLPAAPDPTKISSCEIKCKKNLASLSQSHAAAYKLCYDACIKGA